MFQPNMFQNVYRKNIFNAFYNLKYTEDNFNIYLVNIRQ